jgi:putative DNA primase/helicase
MTVAALTKEIEQEAMAASFSEDAFADIFVEKYRDKLRYDHTSGRWYEFDGAAWRKDETGIGEYYARITCREHGDGRKEVGKRSFHAAVERCARVVPGIAVTNEIFDRDEWLLGTPDGTVNLINGKTIPASPGQYISKLTACGPQPGRPDLWLGFLEEATGGDQQVIDFLQMWCGYALTGMTNEHTFLFVHGGGGNGKSVFLNTVSKILGDYATTAPMETFTASKFQGHSTDLAMLAGARLVTASETEEGRAWAEAKIKQMTGADPITARFMRQDNFTFIPKFKLTIVGNHAPVVENADAAMRRRFRILSFDRKPKRPDMALEAKLKEEWPQILAWMIEGTEKWRTGGLTIPEAMKSATDAYFEAQDVMGQFLESYCVVRKGAYERKNNLFQAWVNFCRENGEEPGRQRSFTQQLEKLGFRSSRDTTSSRHRVMRGIELKHKPGGEG